MSFTDPVTLIDSDDNPYQSTMEEVWKWKHAYESMLSLVNVTFELPAGDHAERPVRRLRTLFDAMKTELTGMG